MTKFFALVRRALQTESRLARGHLFRCLLGGFVLWTLVTTRWEVFGRTAPGLNLFRSMSYYNYFFISILGTAYFATAITEEKEERTLGLLKMAGVGATSLIMGKWTPRMISAFLLLSVQIPFTVLAITLGGVLWHQIAAVYLALFAHLFFVGSLGLLSSVLMATTTGACLLALGSLLALNVIPGILQGIFRSSSETLIYEFASFLRSMNAFGSIGLSLSTGFNASWMSTQVLSNLVVGLIFLVITWSVFDICTKNEKEAGGLNYFDKLRKRMKGKARGRVWNSPFIWKDYQLLGGGGVFLTLKFAVYFLFILIFAISTSFSPSRWIDYLGGMFIGWSLFFLVFEIAIMTARLYRTEITDKTWATLVMLPRSSNEIFYTKLIGGLTTTLPAIVCFCIGVLLTPDEFFDAIGSIMSDGDALFGFTYSVLQIIIGVHLSTYFSITQKWAIWPMSVFLSTFIVFICNMTLVGCLVTGFSPSEAAAVFFMGDVASTIIIVIIHYQIGKRLIIAAEE